MFNTDQPSPYEVTPLASLRYVRPTTNDLPISLPTVYPARVNQQQQQQQQQQPVYPSHPSHPSGGSYNAPRNPMPMNMKELSEESGFRLLDLIWEEGGTVIISEEQMAVFKRNRQRATKQINQAQNRPQFYVPPSGGGSTHNNISIRSMFDSLTNQANLKTMSNVRRITKDVLLYNGITLDMVLRRARVPVSELKGANIVTSFADLVELGFKPEDLLIDRALFNCNTLRHLFEGTTYQVIVSHGVAFNLEHLMMDNSFLSSELNALGFPLGQLIDRGDIQQSQLRALKFPFSELLGLGLRQEHLTKLGIDKEVATRQRTPDGRGGFGWTLDEFESLALC